MLTLHKTCREAPVAQRRTLRSGAGAGGRDQARGDQVAGAQLEAESAEQGHSGDSKENRPQVGRHSWARDDG